MSRPVLEDGEVRRLLGEEGAPYWELTGGALVKKVRCPSFRAALDFACAVGELAEAADHHPDIDIRYRNVTLSLVTHDAGGITQSDLDLARQIDRVTPDLSGGVS